MPHQDIIMSSSGTFIATAIGLEWEEASLTLSGKTASSMVSSNFMASSYEPSAISSSTCSPQPFILNFHNELPSLAAKVLSTGVLITNKGDFAFGEAVSSRKVCVVVEGVVTSVEADEGSKGKESVCDGWREIEDRIWSTGDGEKETAVVAGVALVMEEVDTEPAGSSVKMWGLTKAIPRLVMYCSLTIRKVNLPRSSGVAGHST